MGKGKGRKHKKRIKELVPSVLKTVSWEQKEEDVGGRYRQGHRQVVEELCLKQIN